MSVSLGNESASSLRCYNREFPLLLDIKNGDFQLVSNPFDACYKAPNKPETKASISDIRLLSINYKMCAFSSHYLHEYGHVSACRSTNYCTAEIEESYRHFGASLQFYARQHHLTGSSTQSDGGLTWSTEFTLDLAWQSRLNDSIYRGSLSQQAQTL